MISVNCYWEFKLSDNPYKVISRNNSVILIIKLRTLSQITTENNKYLILNI